jgi:hypothetical protein
LSLALSDETVETSETNETENFATLGVQTEDSFTLGLIVAAQTGFSRSAAFVSSYEKPRTYTTAPRYVS